MSRADPASVAEVLRLARDKPSRFFKAIWPGGEQWQLTVPEAVRAFPRTVVVSSNGAGKTWTVARTAIAHLLSHRNSKVITTAGTWVQVRRQIWGEIAAAHVDLPSWLDWGKLNTIDWTLSGEWYALGLSTDRAEHFEGFHSPNTLCIVDEGKVVTQGVFDSINRIFSGRGSPRLLVVSSAGEPDGPHYDAFNNQGATFARLRVSPYEAWIAPPGVSEANAIQLERTKALTEDYIEYLKDLYGEESPQFRSMVLAHWTEDSSSWCLFPPSVIKDMRDDYAPERGMGVEVWVGADVAQSISGDESAFKAVERWTDTEDGRVHYRESGAEQFHTDDPEIFAERLIQFASNHGAGPETTNLDGTGLGGPVATILRMKGWEVNSIVASSNPEIESPRLANKRAQLWWEGKEIARRRCLHNVRDDWTLSQLAEPRYGLNSRGEITIEPKEQTSARVTRDRPRSPWRSPDRGDALLLALHTPFRKVKATPLSSLGDFY